MLKDRRKVKEQNSHLTFHLFFDILIGGHPLLTRLHEINCPRLWNEDDLRIWIRSSHDETPKKP